VLGVILGGIIATRFGWQAAFGIVGVPGLLLALAYLRVRDYRTVTPAPDADRQSKKDMIGSIFRSATVRWVCIGAAAELITVSALWAWLPSFLNRSHGVAPDRAGVLAALVVLAGACGSLVLGFAVDRAGTRNEGNKFLAVAVFSLMSMVTLMFAFGARHLGVELSQTAQFGIILFGGFLATCTIGPAAAIVLDVIHPGVRSTGASVLSLFQNLFGLAIGPFLGGWLSDAVGLDNALALTPLACIVAASCFLMARSGYVLEAKRADGLSLAPA
jgi:predicted MFS family arabinose efflux permease